MSQEKPIVIAYCRGSMVHGDFCHALAMLSMHAVAHGLWIGHQVLTTSLICAGRNYIVDKALKMPGGFSHLLMLDTDMHFPADTLARLLSHNLPMVGVSYCMRMEPRCMTHLDMDTSSELPAMGEYAGDVFPVLSLGMGCVLIREDVLRELDKATPEDSAFFQVDYRGRTSHLSEDNTFCKRVRRVGFEIYCDIKLSRQVRHVGLYPYSADDIQAIRKPGQIIPVDKASESVVLRSTSDEVIEKTGELFPPEVCEWKVPQVCEWKAYPYGGGAPLPLGILSEAEAAGIVAERYGTVTHIDNEHGFIFYKPKNWDPGANR